jgi:L-methionine (R)-S-oxide reductase
MPAEARMTAIDWLKTFLKEHGAVAGTVHRRVAPDLLALDAAVNIPEPVQRATQEVPSGKGMAGIALAENRCVSTCNLKDDKTGQVRPGAKAVDAAAAVAIPVHDGDGNVRAVVGIAWAGTKELSEAELNALQEKAGTLR